MSRVVCALMGCFFIFGTALAQAPVKPVATASTPTSAPTSSGTVSVTASSTTSSTTPIVSAPIVAAKSYVVLDTQSHQILAVSNGDQKMEPASLTKMMTAYVVFQALKDKRISLSQPVTISQAAYKAVGSRMFADPKTPVSVEDLIKGMIIQSGNDASIALAELVGGTEATFVDIMNKQAQRMSLSSTRFTNSTGLPDPQHVSTANDMVQLARALIEDFPAEYATYYAQKDFTYNRITQPNRNRLLWLDPTVDGVKTGHTDNAGFCLVASAKRPGAAGTTRRIITVVMGTSGMDARAQESSKLLNWAFQNFDTVRFAQAGKALVTPEIWKGTKSVASLGFLQDAWISLPKGSSEKIKTEITRPQPLIAPIAKGQNIGSIKLLIDGKVIVEKPVQALEDVPQAGLLGRAWDSMRLWFK
jgi:D-alanyl-D-alanine carboxypeptidase (penicillin-binding protein 5/6)